MDYIVRFREVPVKFMEVNGASTRCQSVSASEATPFPTEGAGWSAAYKYRLEARYCEVVSRVKAITEEQAKRPAPKDV
jgi:hypothetical protein